MRYRAVILGVVLALCLGPVGCGDRSVPVPETGDISQPSDSEGGSELMAFYPEASAVYRGPGDYYHEISGAIREKGAVRIVGEVQNSGQVSLAASAFEILWTTQGDQLLQAYTGAALEESRFQEHLVLLTAPLELGRSWQFSAKERSGKTRQVTATLVEVAEDLSAVTVRYETSGGYYEVRTLERGKGTTAFRYPIDYEGMQVISGYELSSEPARFMPSPYDDMPPLPEEVSIPYAVKDVIRTFERAWGDYVKSPDPAHDIFKCIEPESAAEAVIQTVISADLSYVYAYPYAFESRATSLSVSVVEIFQQTSGERTVQKMRYYLREGEDGILRIYDFNNVTAP